MEGSGEQLACSSNLRIRVATLADAPRCHEIYVPYVRDTAVTFEYEPPTLDEFRTRMAKTLERYPYLVAEQTDPASFATDGPAAVPRIIGYMYVSPFKARPAYDWAVETSIYVDRACRRGGVGRALHDAMERCLAAQGILNMEACIATTEVEDEHLTNDSWRFHERMGYRLVGEFKQCGFKYGRWWNMIWMERHIGEHRSDQPPITPFPQVRDQVRERYGIG